MFLKCSFNEKVLFVLSSDKQLIGLAFVASVDNIEVATPLLSSFKYRSAAVPFSFFCNSSRLASIANLFKSVKLVLPVLMRYSAQSLKTYCADCSQKGSEYDLLRFLLKLNRILENLSSSSEVEQSCQKSQFLLLASKGLKIISFRSGL